MKPAPVRKAVPGKVQKIQNYQAFVLPLEPKLAPISLTQGIWVPVADFEVGDEVSLIWFSGPSSGLWKVFRPKHPAL